MTTPVAPETPAIPASHLDLLTRPICGVLTTMGRGGQPQSSLVWVDWDGTCARVNTTLERQKGRNLAANPKVSLLVVDPDNPARYLQLRGDAELVSHDALDHLDKLTRSYTRHPAYYGHIYPAAQRWRETRVIGRIHAWRITLDAIHARAEPNRCAEECQPSRRGLEAQGDSLCQPLEANMSATALEATLRELEAQLAHPPGAGSFDEGELQGLPDPVWNRPVERGRVLPVPVHRLPPGHGGQIGRAMTDASLANVVFAAFPVAFAAVTVTLYRPSSGRRGPRRPASGIPMSAPAPPGCARLEPTFARLRCSTT